MPGDEPQQSDARQDARDDELAAGCYRMEAAQPGETWRGRVKRFIVFSWPLFAIPGFLTALFYTFGWFPWQMIPLAYVMNFIVTLCIGGAIILSRMLVEKRFCRIKPAWRAHTVGGVVTVVGVVVGAELALRCIDLLSPWVEMSTSRKSLIGVGLVISAVIYIIEATYERLRDRARRVELREQQAQQQALRAQFEALQARTNPHFLYNSLNTVAGLIEEDPKSAEQALEKLSDMFRYTLEGSRRQQVRLADEVRTVRGYLEMEELRFGNRLRYQVDVPDDLSDLAVPPLLLQPLVENAVLHGISPRREGGSVRVGAAQTDGLLELIVEDDGPGPGHSTHEGSHTSLDELSKRLELLYGDRARIDSGAGANGGFRIRVQLPARPYAGASADEENNAADGARPGRQRRDGDAPPYEASSS